jgi:SET domain-containing protein
MTASKTLPARKKPVSGTRKPASSPQEKPAEPTERIEVAPGKPWHIVRRSRIHGSGVFAARGIPAGTRLIEYIGEHITSAEADRRHPVNPDDPFHTFFFAIAGGTVIDGGIGGNDARWINHSCEPNCETEETDDGRVFVVSLQPIARGEELNYDYGLVIDERLTKKLRDSYMCRCGTPSCRGTMLALKKPRARKAASA